jgi:hypothetical protein
MPALDELAQSIERLSVGAEKGRVERWEHELAALSSADIDASVRSTHLEAVASRSGDPAPPEVAS